MACFRKAQTVFDVSEAKVQERAMQQRPNFGCQVVVHSEGEKMLKKQVGARIIMSHHFAVSAAPVIERGGNQRAFPIRSSCFRLERKRRK